jgi:glucans biosynthesis protein C
MRNPLARRGLSQPRAGSEGATSPSKSAPRHAEFDALRGTAILLVVTLHAGLAYTRLDVPRLLWGVRDPSPHLAFDLFSWWSMGVSVSLFFAISGYFAAKVERSRGPVEFLKGRFRRVVVPLLAVIPILLPLCFFAWSGGWLASGRATPHEWWRMRFDDPAIMTDLYGPAHLWFLEYLIPMLVVFGLWRKGELDREAQKAKIRADLAARERKVQAGRGLRRKKVRADLASRRPGTSADFEDRTWLLSPWAPLILAVPTILLLMISRAVTGVDAALDRHNSFFPGPIRLLYYSTFFAFGVGLFRVRGRLDALESRGWWYLLASIPAFAARAWLLRLDWSSPLDGLGAFALAASGGLTTWLTLFGLLGVYRKHFNRPSPTIRYLADASFWIYLAHLPLVGLIQLDLLDLPIPTLAKFAVTWTLTLGLGIASYHVLVRRKGLGRFLNGGFQLPMRRVLRTKRAEGDIAHS